MSKPINANVNFNTNHTADANTNTNHTANANTNQHRRDAADEKEVQGSTIIDLEVDYEPPSYYFEPYGDVFSCNYRIPSSPSLTPFSKVSEYNPGRPPSRARICRSVSSSLSLTPFSNGLFDLHSFSTNELPQAQPRPPVASPSSELFQLNGLPRLSPPSEIQARGELAANMSVDIEADVWGVAGGSPVASGDGGGIGHGNGGGSTSNSNSKGKNRNLKQQHHPEEPNASHPHEGDPDEFHYPSHDHQEQGLEPELLNSSESLQLRPPPISRLRLPPISRLLRPPTLRTTASPSSTENSNSNRRKFDWVKAEKNWDTSVPLTRMEQVWEGDCWVGWKVGCFFFFLRFFLPGFFSLYFFVFFLFSFSPFFV